MSEASTTVRYCTSWQGISIVSWKGFDTALTHSCVSISLLSLFLLMSGTNDAPPPRKSVVMLPVGLTPSLGRRPRRYLAGPFHSFPDGHCGACGSLTVAPSCLLEEAGCACTKPSIFSSRTPGLVHREDSAPAAAGSLSSYRPDAWGMKRGDMIPSLAMHCEALTSVLYTRILAWPELPCVKPHHSNVWHTRI